MKKITKTVCMLDEISIVEFTQLKELMGQSDDYTISDGENCIGFGVISKPGCWWCESEDNNWTILTYTEMVNLLSPQPIKLSEMALAESQLLCAKSQAGDIHQLIIDNHAEQTRLQAIIDKPEVKTGRVLFVDDLVKGDKYFIFTGNFVDSYSFDADDIDERIINAGMAFHDRESCEQYRRELITAQSLRRQVAKANP